MDRDSTAFEEQLKLGEGKSNLTSWDEDIVGAALTLKMLQRKMRDERERQI